MANIPIKDGNGDVKYLKMNGAGTLGDPYVPVQDVNIQDQTSSIINLGFHQTGAASILASNATIGDSVISLVDATGFTPGNLLLLFSVAGNRWTPFEIVSVNANDVTLDSPVDYGYLAGDTVEEGNHNLGVDGSVTPQVFHLRSGDPGLTIYGDITRIILSFMTATTPTYGDFGDGVALTNGLLFRKKFNDGTYQNVFNVKSNSDIAAIAYDLDIFSGVGLDGLKARMTFAGQNKMGVTLRIAPDEDLEIVVQDDLSGLTHFHVQAQGHVVV